MSVDLCFWESGDSDGEELYEEAPDGIEHVFVASVRVLEFRAELLRRWPGPVDSVEPLEFNSELEASSDLAVCSGDSACQLERSHLHDP